MRIKSLIDAILICTLLKVHFLSKLHSCTQLKGNLQLLKLQLIKSTSLSAPSITQFINVQFIKIEVSMRVSLKK
ncbi:hypothetical protein D3C76_1590440 [compost metagenome]